MPNPDFSIHDARQILRLGEAADLWGGTDPKYVQTMPYVQVPDPPSSADEPSFSNFALLQSESKSSFGAVLKTDTSWLKTKEKAPNGYAVMKLLEEAAESGDLPVLDPPPLNKMTRVRREDLEVFARKMLAERHWSLPWFLFPEVRPSNEPAKAVAEQNTRLWLIEEMNTKRRGEKRKDEYLAYARQEFKCSKDQFQQAWKSAAKITGSGWDQPGRPKGT